MTEISWNWDPNKAAINRSKHGLSFEAASLVFEDPYLLSDLDPYESEVRWRTMGMAMGVLIVVVHTEPVASSDAGTLQGRIISARKATPAERREYHNG
ncbi:BrnT family toxin [Sphingomonas sp.]|uniref:BrnT family toxin n=1 Tax=Sphingomonas sp. TaxID=28214 RepID=UPI0039C8C9FB